VFFARTKPQCRHRTLLHWHRQRLTDGPWRGLRASHLGRRICILELGECSSDIRVSVATHCYMRRAPVWYYGIRYKGDVVRYDGRITRRPRVTNTCMRLAFHRHIVSRLDENSLFRVNGSLPTQSRRIQTCVNHPLHSHLNPAFLVHNRVLGILQSKVAACQQPRQEGFEIRNRIVLVSATIERKDHHSTTHLPMSSEHLQAHLENNIQTNPTAHFCHRCSVTRPQHRRKRLPN
jgi:hypothetical protein